MSTQLKIQLTPDAEKAVAGMQTLPVRVVNYIAAGMNQENKLTMTHVQRAHLNGTGPFPPSEHKLGVRSGHLWQSVNASAAVIAGNTVDTAIGSNILYAAVHEFGARIRMPARQQTIRHRLDARGNLVKQFGNSNLLMFAKKTHKRARKTIVAVGEHIINMPERAPFRTGIQECAPNYTKTISAHIIEAWKGLQ